MELGRRYVGSLPSALVHAAADSGLTLIAFKREVPFVEITEAVHARIIDAQLEELRASERLHEAFTELSVAGASPDEIVRQAAILAGRPVILADLSHRVLACEPGSADPTRLLAGFARRSRTLSASSASGRTVYDEAAVRSRALGVPVDGRRLIAMVLRLRDPSGPGTLGVSAHARVLDVADAAAAACRAERIPSLVGTPDDARAGAMLSLSPRADPDRVLVGLAARISERVGAAPDGLVIGVGVAVGSIRDVRRSFLEASQVADVAAERPDGWSAEGSSDRPAFYRLADLRLRGLLHLLRDDPRVQPFVERELGPLLASEPDTSLLNVLGAYLAAGGNKAEAAKSSHLARPTFYERLRRIERILGTDLGSAESRTSLHVAMLALDAARTG